MCKRVKEIYGVSIHLHKRYLMISSFSSATTTYYVTNSLAGVGLGLATVYWYVCNH